MSAGQILQRNLGRLQRRHRALARCVEQADDSAVEQSTGPRGACTLGIDGVLLGSAYDPAGEGTRLAERITSEAPDLIVLIGFGLGHHLDALLHDPEIPLLIYEPSPERLRAALALNDWGWIDAAQVHWAADPGELGRRFRDLYTPRLRVQVFVHPALARLDPTGARESVQRVARSKDEADVNTVTRVGQTAKWSRRAVENLPHLLRSPSVSHLFGAFRGVPAVVAAAGPSLDRQLPVLARYADRVLVIAIGQSLRALRRAGIEPDLVHVIDGPDVSHQIRDAGDPSGLHLVLFPSVAPRLFELPVRSRFVSYPITNPVACWIASALGETHFVRGGATVAQSAVHLAAALGAGPVLLVGQDLAFTGGRVYATDSAYDMVSYRQTEEGRFVLTGFDQKVALLGQEAEGPDSPAQELIWVEGWDGGRLPTSRGYASFIEQYEPIGRTLAAQGIPLVNCTEGGARIPGLAHRPFQETLAQCAGPPSGARGTIRARFDAARPASPASLRALAAQAGRSLQRLEREVRAGLSRIQRAPGELRRARHPEQGLRVLRGIARAERQVGRELARVPWLEALFEHERQEDEVALRRTQGDTSPERSVEHCERRLRSVLAGLERGGDLLRRLNQSLEAAEPGCEEALPPRPSAAAGS